MHIFGMEESWREGFCSIPYELCKVHNENTLVWPFSVFKESQFNERILFSYETKTESVLWE